MLVYIITFLVIAGFSYAFYKWTMKVKEENLKHNLEQEILDSKEEIENLYLSEVERYIEFVEEQIGSDYHQKLTGNELLEIGDPSKLVVSIYGTPDKVVKGENFKNLVYLDNNLECVFEIKDSKISSIKKGYELEFLWEKGDDIKSPFSEFKFEKSWLKA